MSFGLLLITTAFATAADIRSAGIARGTPIKSSWSKDSTWEGNVVPGPGDNVTISNGDTVIIDLEMRKEVTDEMLHTKAQWSPYFQGCQNFQSR